MSEARVYVRPSLRDLREVPLDTDSALQAIAALTPLQRGVWFALRTHLWIYGRLPATPKELAAIGGVTPRTFEKMAPAVSCLFYRDAQGRWRDLELEDERHKRLDLPPGEAAEPFPASAPRALSDLARETRRQNAARTNEKRWGERRRRLELIDGGRTDSNVEPSTLPPAVANAIATGIAKPADGVVDLPENFAAGLRSSVSHAPSLPHRPESDSDSDSGGSGEDLIETRDRRDREPGVSSDRKAGEAIATAATGIAPGAVAEPIADGIAKAETVPLAKGPSQLLAQVSAGAVARVDAPAPLPYTVAEALGDLPLAQPSSIPLPPDAVMIAALRKAGGDRVPNGLLGPQAIEPIRELVRAGCDFARDIVPAVEATVPVLSGPLRSWRAEFIQTLALGNRDLARSQAIPAENGDSALAFVEEDTPFWRAWLAYRRVKSFPKTDRKGYAKRGWVFPSLWPPGADPVAFGERAAADSG